MQRPWAMRFLGTTQIIVRMVHAFFHAWRMAPATRQRESGDVTRFYDYRIGQSRLPSAVVTLLSFGISSHKVAVHLFVAGFMGCVATGNTEGLQVRWRD